MEQDFFLIRNYGAFYHLILLILRTITIVLFSNLLFPTILFAKTTLKIKYKTR